MDPDQAFKDIRTALEVGEYAEASDAAGNLIVWLQEGGFEPKLTDEQRSELLMEWLTATQDRRFG